jgi:chromate reductase, NAD(P)H dehydrogenase (quinone)
MTTVLAISGSLRKGSLNSGLVRAAVAHAPAGVEVKLYDGLAALPHYNQDLEDAGAPAEVVELRRQIKAADAVLISTPEYNGSLPGALKDLIDWASRPYGTEASFYSKPVAVVSVSPTDYGAVWAADHLRKALGIAGARVADIEFTVAGANSKFDESGDLTDPETIGRLDEVLETLVQHHRSLAV